MLLKWIVCQVAPERRAEFSLAQEAWARLGGADGFRGQVGGWDEAPAPPPAGSPRTSAAACVLAAWTDAERYRAFMRPGGLHDAIVGASGQLAAFESSRVWLLESDAQSPAESIGPGLEAALRALPKPGEDTGFLRVAECLVRPGREASFRQAQREVWNPGMARADGMLGGAFARSPDDPRRFLVATVWRSASAHERYVRELFPELRERSGAGGDLESVRGRRAALLDSWRVVPPAATE